MALIKKFKLTFEFMYLMFTLKQCFDDNSRSGPLFKLIDKLISLGLYKSFNNKVMEKIQPNDQKKKELDLSVFDSSRYGTFSDNSVGHHYFIFMRSLNLSPKFYKKIMIDDFEKYAIMKVRMAHDLWHTVTGFDSSPMGEVKIQGFIFAQTQAPISSILIGAKMILSTLKGLNEVPEIFDAVVEGYTAGKKARSLVDVDWENQMQKDLQNFRIEFNLIP